MMLNRLNVNKNTFITMHTLIPNLSMAENNIACVLVVLSANVSCENGMYSLIQRKFVVMLLSVTWLNIVPFE